MAPALAHPGVSETQALRASAGAVQAPAVATPVVGVKGGCLRARCRKTIMEEIKSGRCGGEKKAAASPVVGEAAVVRYMSIRFVVR